MNQSISDSLYARKHNRVAVAKPGKHVSISTIGEVLDFAISPSVGCNLVNSSLRLGIFFQNLANMPVLHTQNQIRATDEFLG